MKFVFLIFLVFCHFTVFGSFKDHWDPLRKILDENSTYKGRHGSLLSVTKEKTNNFYPKLFKNKKFIKAIQKAKKETLANIKITNWQANDPKVIFARNGHVKVFMKGSYTDSRRRKTYFTEVHYYTPSNTLQLLFTNRNKKNLNKDTQAVSLNHIKKQHGF